MNQDSSNEPEDSLQQSNNLSKYNEDSISKKVKLNDESVKINRISRKTSDDLIKAFERLPQEQIDKLLEVIKDKDQPDLHVKLNVASLIQNENDEQESEEKKRKKRESKEKECPCCKQVVKRHHCTHSNCAKPCLFQEKLKKIKA